MRMETAVVSGNKGKKNKHSRQQHEPFVIRRQNEQGQGHCWFVRVFLSPSATLLNIQSLHGRRMTVGMWQTADQSHPSAFLRVRNDVHVNENDFSLLMEGKFIVQTCTIIMKQFNQLVALLIAVDVLQTAKPFLLNLQEAIFTCF